MLFVRGLGLGLEAEFAKNLTVCIDDENTVLKDFSLAFSYLRHGIDSISVRSVEEGLKLLGEGLFEVRAVFQECGVKEGVSDIEAIAKDLQSGPIGWVELIAKEVLNILSHRKNLGHFLREAIKKFDAHDFYRSGVDTGCAVAILIEDKPLSKLGRAEACKMEG